MPHDFLDDPTITETLPVRCPPSIRQPLDNHQPTELLPDEIQDFPRHQRAPAGTPCCAAPLEGGGAAPGGGGPPALGVPIIGGGGIN